MDDHSEAASQLRLSSAKRRIDAFLEQIGELAESSFPHDDGLFALRTIRDNFVDLRGRLELPPGARADLVDQTCLHIGDQVSDYTEILGFILRSTNVRNPFELHYVIKRLITKALDQDVSLLLSSEWAFVPFTYPMSMELLPDFVLIGNAAPESNDPLVIPLAGHEIGHSAWRVFGCPVSYSSLVSDMVVETLDARPGVCAELMRQHTMDALALGVIRDRCSGHVMRQLEEMFCDLFGLYTFGQSYLFAYDYLLGPGGSSTTLDYPTDKRRFELLNAAAAELGISVDPVLAQRWTTAGMRRSERSVSTIVDIAVDGLIPRIKEDLFHTLKSKDLFPPSAEVTNSVLKSFGHNEPYCDDATLGEIISAGWLYLRQNDGLAEAEQRRRYKVLGDLVLKSVEVAEYLDRTRPDA